MIPKTEGTGHSDENRFRFLTKFKSKLHPDRVVKNEKMKSATGSIISEGSATNQAPKKIGKATWLKDSFRNASFSGVMRKIGNTINRFASFVKQGRNEEDKTNYSQIEITPPPTTEPSKVSDSLISSDSVILSKEENISNWKPRFSPEFIAAVKRFQGASIESNAISMLSLTLSKKLDSSAIENNTASSSEFKKFIKLRLDVVELVRIIAKDDDLKGKLQWYQKNLDKAKSEGGIKLSEFLDKVMDLWWCNICALKAIYLKSVDNLQPIQHEMKEYEDVKDSLAIEPVDSDKSLQIRLQFVLDLLDSLPEDFLKT